jgi:hypothetical protein
MLAVIRPRAERVQIKIPVMYHQPGDDHWFHARIVNLSESGVLFEPSELPPGTNIEVMLSPPIQIGDLAPGKQVCAAEVVRTTEQGGVAVRFDECRFLLES